MTEQDAERIIANNIADAISKGVHQMAMVSILEAQKFSILLQASNPKKANIIKLERKPFDGGN